MRQHPTALLCLSPSSVRDLCAETGGLCSPASLWAAYSVDDLGVGHTHLSSEMEERLVRVGRTLDEGFGVGGGSWETGSDRYRKMGPHIHGFLPTTEGTYSYENKGAGSWMTAGSVGTGCRGAHLLLPPVPQGFWNASVKTAQGRRGVPALHHREAGVQGRCPLSLLEMGGRGPHCFFTFPRDLCIQVLKGGGHLQSAAGPHAL